MATKFPPMSDFARAFAAEYKGFMKAAQVTGADIASKLGRNEGYVSERVSGKRALDTNDVDALASLVDGWTGKTLLAELARRVRETGESNTPKGELIEGNFGGRVDGSRDDVVDDPAAAASNRDMREPDTDEGFEG